MNNMTLTAKVSDPTPGMMGETPPTPTGEVVFERPIIGLRPIIGAKSV
jgi:hypothetical protein